MYNCHRVLKIYKYMRTLSPGLGQAAGPRSSISTKTLVQPQWVLSSVSKLWAVTLSATWGTSLATRWIGTMLAAPSRESSSSGHKTGSEKKHWQDFEVGGADVGARPTFNNAVVSEVQVEQEEHVQQCQSATEKQSWSLTHRPRQQRCHLQTSIHYYNQSDERGRTGRETGFLPCAAWTALPAAATGSRRGSGSGCCRWPAVLGSDWTDRNPRETQEVMSRFQ